MIQLLLMALYGVILGFFYQCFLAFTTRLRSVAGAIFCYSCAALLCFLLTASFLFFVNGGNWGVYGFLAMAAGFILYYRLLWRRGKKPVARGEAALAACGRGLHLCGSKIISLASFPFGKAVDKGDQLWEKAEERWKKRNTAAVSENEKEKEAEIDGSELP